MMPAKNALISVVFLTFSILNLHALRTLIDYDITFMISRTDVIYNNNNNNKR